ncbi:MAG TPA: response regulator transcription factor [Acetobacteraceae bacterium]|nr:response regulator transcription factor [Acetobacteraceae bacterium]
MKILLVDDHSIVRAGLRGLLATRPRTELLEAATGEDALTLVRDTRPDLVILDLNLPGIGGLELLRRLLAGDRTARVLVLSMHAEPLYAARAMEAGARGYASKNIAPEELLRAVQKVAEGGRYIENDIAQELAMQTVSAASPLGQLADRDLEILRYLAEGRSMTDIAGALSLSYKTVANACSQIKAKLGVARTADLIRVAIEMGLAAG